MFNQSKKNLFRLSALINTRSSHQEKGFAHSVFYLETAKKDVSGVIRQMITSPDGLFIDEAQKRLGVFGHNELAAEKNAWPQQLGHILANPLIILLAFLSLLSYATGDIKAAILMSSMVAISATLTFVQEFRSNQAATQLKKMVSTKATVNRITGREKGTAGAVVPLAQRKEIPLSELVPGDLILLSAGDMVPSDVRLLAAKDLFISQSALTGEALPVEKFAEPESDKVKNVLDLKNVCFMGSNVISGTASGIVMKTGGDTYVGSIATSVAKSRPSTNFDRGIERFTWLMLRFMFVMVPLVFLVNGFTKGDWFESFLFAIAVAVGLTPEMLPMIVTVNLGKGALAMAKRRVIVKRLSSIQNFGAMDILCTDKTGTLTQDLVVLEKYVDVLGDEDRRVLEYAFLNSYYQTGLKNLLDRAILNRVEVAGDLKIDGHYRKVDEIPFDFNRRRMSVIVARRNESHILICKGALEEMIKACTSYEKDKTIFPLDKEAIDRCTAVAAKLNDDGLRVVAVAYKEEPPSTTVYSIKEEAGLTLLGFVAFLDPPKESTAHALQILKAHGVQVKVLTGDNDRVTRKVCRLVGLPADRVLLGEEIEAMSDADLSTAAEEVTIFAKLNPAQKERIVKALQSRDHVVGFLGDGINDSPALKAADVGISVDTAVDVAKESADIILLEKNLLVLEEGILEGRRVFGNIIKYIKMGASSSFGNVFSVLGSSILLPFLPMLPVQLLTQNLLYDISQTGIPFDDVDPEYLEKPRKWQIGNISRFMIFMGPVSSLFDFATFGLMWWVFRANTVERQALFQSGWFIEGLLSQTLVVHIIRTKKIPFIQSQAATPLLITSAVVVMAGISIPFTPLGTFLGMVPLPLSYFPVLFGLLLLYGVLAHLVKSWFIRKYGFE